MFKWLRKKEIELAQTINVYPTGDGYVKIREEEFAEMVKILRLVSKGEAKVGEVTVNDKRLEKETVHWCLMPNTTGSR